jgi:hypothetical protein
MATKKRHRLGRVARRLMSKRRSSMNTDLSEVVHLGGFGGFADLGQSLESIATHVPPAADVSGGSFNEALAAWVARLQEAVDAHWLQTFSPGNRAKYPNLGRRRVVTERGPKYVRIVTRDVNPRRRQRRRLHRKSHGQRVQAGELPGADPKFYSREHLQRERPTTHELLRSR